MKKQCVTCGTDFEARSNRQVYCSDRCRLGTATCQTCGTEFVKTKGSNGLFCSSECWYGSDRGPRNKPVRVAKPKPEKQKQKRERRCAVTKICPACKSEFLTRLERQECCSRSCARKMHNERFGNPRWKGGTARHGSGYVKRMAKDHPAADSGGYVMEHRIVMEEQLGRYLEPWERVHHKNGDRADNRPDNLEMWILKGQSKKDPAGQRVADLIEHAVDVADRFGIHPPAARELLQSLLLRRRA